MKIKEYIHPILIFKSLKECLIELEHYKKYKSIIAELEQNGSLDRMKIVKEDDYLLIGVDLNPELLIYAEDAIESAELRMVADRMKKYSVFLQKEGILDSVKANHERIKSEDYYGYLINISFDFKKYSKFKLRYSISYFIGLFLIITTLIGLVIKLI